MAGILGALIPNAIKGIAKFATDIGSGKGFGESIKSGLGTAIGGTAQNAAELLPKHSEHRALDMLPKEPIMRQGVSMGGGSEPRPMMAPSLSAIREEMREPKEIVKENPISEKNVKDEDLRDKEARLDEEIDRLIEDTKDEEKRAKLIDELESLMDNVEEKNLTNKEEMREMIKMKKRFLKRKKRRRYRY